MPPQECSSTPAIAISILSTTQNRFEICLCLRRDCNMFVGTSRQLRDISGSSKGIPFKGNCFSLYGDAQIAFLFFWFTWILFTAPGLPTSRTCMSFLSPWERSIFMCMKNPASHLGWNSETFWLPYLCSATPWGGEHFIVEFHLVFLLITLGKSVHSWSCGLLFTCLLSSAMTKGKR